MATMEQVAVKATVEMLLERAAPLTLISMTLLLIVTKYD